MKLSKTSIQAALALGFLADQHSDQFIQARQIAQKLDMPTVSALKILQALTRHHLLESQLGRSGGYRMNVEPEKLTLLEVVETMDGPICGQLRIKNMPDAVAHGAQQLCKVCNTAAESLRVHLSRTTIADLQCAG